MKRNSLNFYFEKNLKILIINMSKLNGLLFINNLFFPKIIP